MKVSISVTYPTGCSFSFASSIPLLLVEQDSHNRCQKSILDLLANVLILPGLSVPLLPIVVLIARFCFFDSYIGATCRHFLVIFWICYDFTIFEILEFIFLALSR